MGFGQHHGDHPDMNDDDESEQEDVALTSDDALIAVAKTEDVRGTSIIEFPSYLGRT